MMSGRSTFRATVLLLTAIVLGGCHGWLFHGHGRGHGWGHYKHGALERPVHTTTAETPIAPSGSARQV